jgi:hypothetical protein
MNVVNVEKSGGSARALTARPAGPDFNVNDFNVTLARKFALGANIFG